MLSILLSFIFSQFGLLVLAIAGLLYYQKSSKKEYFNKQGIKYVEPLPLIGNMIRPLMKKETYCEYYQKIYDAFPRESIIGEFAMFLSQNYIIKDPELLKQIQIKEFDSFMNHRPNLENDPVFGKNLLMIRDQRWKEMRTILTPAFTSTKMKFMFELVRKCAQSGINYLHDEARTQRGVYEFEAKDLCSRFANDIIATAAFGLEVNSIKEPNNDFYTHAKEMLSMKISMTIKFVLSLSAPIILKLLKLEILDKKISAYFKGVLSETIRYREQHNVARPDMIQLLLQTKTKGRIDDDESNTTIEHSNKVKWTDDDLVAQGIVFIVAGFDTVSSVLSFMSYELAKNPDIQDRLWTEINNLTQTLNGNEPTYEDISKLKYLEMVMNETMRLWPGSMFTDRLCKKKATVTDSNGRNIIFNPGDSILIPFYQLHRDSQFFPEPEKFDPERFSDDNKQSINQYAYQPFGLGPRSCIGSRFAIMECKIWFYYVLSKFKIETTEKTENPIKMQTGVFQNIPVNGVWLQFRVRD